MSVNPRHDWNAWNNYLPIHEKYLESFDYFILDNQLTYTQTDVLVFWSGVLICTGGIEIAVSKRQDVELRSGRTMVRTVSYSYHVLRRVSDHTLNLFRYDNIHVQPGHADHHHRHRFDESGNEIEPPEHVGVYGWPTLGDVLLEASRIDYPERPSI